MTRRRRRATKSIRGLHRWIGITSAAFLLLLCGSGLLLNHSSALGLDASFVGFDWLLEHYGIGVADPGPSFAVAQRTVSYLEGRLYVDAEPIAGDYSVPAGALEIDGELIIVTLDELIAIGPDGDLLERWPVAAGTGSAVRSIARDPAGLLLDTSDGIFRLDWASTTVEPVDLPGRVDWIVPVSPTADLITAIQEDYRGRGVSWERLIADLHSGRVAGLSGAVVMDLAAMALVLLGISGVILWLRR